MGSAIVVENLTKTFSPAWSLRALLGTKRQGVEALKGVTIEVSKGEIFGVLGPNAGGKTTLLEILATYLLPTSGRAWVDGYDVTDAPLAARRVVGYCPAGAGGFDPRLSGRQNLDFFALLSGIPPRLARERVAFLWEFVGLDRFSDARVSRYSDGMRQRLALARSLLGDPAILLLDEPTRSLDPRTAALWRQVLRERVAGELGKTVLLVTHDLSEAGTVCDRIAILERGRIVAEGPAGEVLATVGSVSFDARC